MRAPNEIGVGWHLFLDDRGLSRMSCLRFGIALDASYFKGNTWCQKLWFPFSMPCNLACGELSISPIQGVTVNVVSTVGALALQ